MNSADNSSRLTGPIANSSNEVGPANAKQEVPPSIGPARLWTTVVENRSRLRDHGPLPLLTYRWPLATRIVIAQDVEYAAVLAPCEDARQQTERGLVVARITQVVVTCDLEDGEVTASDSISFTYNGKTYTLDLCQKHTEEVKNTLEAYAHAGHSAARGPRGRRRATAGGRARSTRPAAAARGESQAEIRQWARAQGYAVGDRGRIPGEVRAAYEAAQAKGGRRR